eukprot:5735221-Pyramimonas_sp.AAC.1
MPSMTKCATACRAGGGQDEGGGLRARRRRSADENRTEEGQRWWSLRVAAESATRGGPIRMFRTTEEARAQAKDG